MLPFCSYPAAKQQAVSKVRHTPAVKHVTHKSAKTTTKKTKIVHKRANHKKIHRKTLSHAVPHKKPVIANDRRQDPIPASVPEQPRSYGFFATMEHKLVDYVHNMVHTLRYSSYKLGGTNFDSDRGVYVVDCSDYVDRILENVYPEAYFDLLNNTGTDKPTSAHFYDFFNELSQGPTRLWYRIQDVEELQAGDVLVFRYKSAYSRMGSGHVMVVMDKPTHDDDVYFVRVTDSAPSGHSADTRPLRVSGIGIGTLMLKTNGDGQPSAYAWKVGSRWKNNVRIAMARPRGIS